MLEVNQTTELLSNPWEHCLKNHEVAKDIIDLVYKLYDEETDAYMMFSDNKENWEHLKIFQLQTSDKEVIYMHIVDGADFRIVYLLNTARLVKELHAHPRLGTPAVPSFVINKKATNVAVYQGISKFISISHVYEFEKMHRTQMLFTKGMLLTKPSAAGKIIECQLTFTELHAMLNACKQYLRPEIDACAKVRDVAKQAAEKIQGHCPGMLDILQEVFSTVHNPTSENWLVEQSGISLKKTSDGFIVKLDEVQTFHVVKSSCTDDLSWNILLESELGQAQNKFMHEAPRLILKIQDEKIVFEAGRWDSVQELIRKLDACICR